MSKKNPESFIYDIGTRKLDKAALVLMSFLILLLKEYLLQPYRSIEYLIGGTIAILPITLIGSAMLAFFSERKFKTALPRILLVFSIASLFGASGWYFLSVIAYRMIVEVKHKTSGSEKEDG